MNLNEKKINGGWYAALAYFLWGFSPLYWKLLHDVPPFEVAMHRIVWSVPTLLLVLLCLGRLKELRILFAQPRVWALLGASALLIALNWFLYIYSIASGRLVEAALGYYICPLITVFFAAVIVKERMSNAQWIAVLLAAIGVLIKMYQTGIFPWLAIAMAASFALYGLIRKQIKVEALMGLAIETMLLFLPALCTVLYWQSEGSGSLLRIGRAHDVYLVLSGAVTMLPLLCYAIGVRNAKLSLVGFLQYIGPTIQLCIAVFLFHEPFEPSTLWSFGVIWAGLVLFVWDSYRQPVIESCV